MRTQVEAFHQRLKVSRLEYNTLLYIVQERDSYQRGDTKRYQDTIVDSSERAQCHAKCLQMAAYQDDMTVYNCLRDWEIPKMPFSAKVLLEGGVPKGRKIARGLEMVKCRWKETEYTATREELEEYARTLLDSGKLT